MPTFYFLGTSIFLNNVKRWKLILEDHYIPLESHFFALKPTNANEHEQFHLIQQQENHITQKQKVYFEF